MYVGIVCRLVRFENLTQQIHLRFNVKITLIPMTGKNKISKIIGREAGIFWQMSESLSIKAQTIGFGVYVNRLIYVKHITHPNTTSFNTFALTFRQLQTLFSLSGLKPD